jgi:TolA-binding protein
MNAKIERVCKEIDKMKGKISELQTRLRELEKQKTELENIEIVEAVRGMDISFADLADLLKAARATSGQIGPKSAAAKNTGSAPGNNTETEDSEDEE